MALGARAADIVWVVVGETLLMVLAAITIGLPATMTLTRFVSNLLFGLPPNDQPTLIAPTTLLAIAAILAVDPR